MEQRALRMPSLLLRRESAVVGHGHGQRTRGGGGEGAVFSTGTNYSRLFYQLHFTSPRGYPEASTHADAHKVKASVKFDFLPMHV